MFLKAIFFFLLFLNFSFASYVTLTIGKIDGYYKNKISKNELRQIINEIEDVFESQLKRNVFDYSKSGKMINLVYVPPSKLEKKIKRNIEKLEKKQRQIDKIQEILPSKKKEVNSLKTKIEANISLVNSKVQEFNNYVQDINKNSYFTKEEYKKIENEVKKRKKQLNKEITLLNKKQREVQKVITKYNNRVNSYNKLINQYNKISFQTEVMSRSFKKLKGMTFGVKEIKVKTFYKNGKKIQEKTIKNSMEKIEIYGFNNKNELKATLAHEIGHLLGVPHINAKNALMNPVLQKNQIENLYLTQEDIKAFKKSF